jgi:hypothetical protein
LLNIYVNAKPYLSPLFANLLDDASVQELGLFRLENEDDVLMFNYA